MRKRLKPRGKKQRIGIESILPSDSIHLFWQHSACVACVESVYFIYRLAPAKVSALFGCATHSLWFNMCYRFWRLHTHDTRYNYVLRFVFFFFFSSFLSLAIFLLFCMMLFRMKVLLSHHILCRILNNKVSNNKLKRCQCVCECGLKRKKNMREEKLIMMMWVWEQRTKENCKQRKPTAAMPTPIYTTQLTNMKLIFYIFFSFFLCRIAFGGGCAWKTIYTTVYAVSTVYTNIEQVTHWRRFFFPSTYTTFGIRTVHICVLFESM